MKRKLFTVIYASMFLVLNAQTFIAEENDTTVMSEYNDGHLWAYRQIGDYVVGMTNYKEKDDYGKYYQIVIFIKNLGELPVTFDPEDVTSTLNNKRGDTLELKVYSYEKYMKKVKRAQTWSLALTGFATGLNAGMAGYQTTYTTSYTPSGMPYTQVHTTYNYAAASVANMAASMQMASLRKMMNDDQKTKSQGYLKKTTVHPDEGIVGYMNIKLEKGQKMTVNIPVGGHVFSFDWDIGKKK